MGLSGQAWLDAQCGVLGSVLISPELAPTVLSQTAETDYTGKNRLVYQAIRALFLAGTPIDAMMVADRLGGGAENSRYLIQLMEILPTAAHVHHYIAACKKQAKIAALKAIGEKMADAEQLEDIQPLLEQANAHLCEKENVRVVSTGDALRAFIDRHTGDKPAYLTWPISALDDYVYAEPGDFIIIGGVPSSGKSAFALQCAWHWGQKQRVGFFSLETGENKLFDRQMAAFAGIPMSKLKNNSMSQEEWNRVLFAEEKIKKTQVSYVPASGMSVADVQAMSISRGFDIVVIDYLQLLNGRGRDPYERVTNISMDLHRFSQSSGRTVIALSQLSRQAKDTKNAEPTMSSLRESGQLEQDADVVFLLYHRAAKDAAEKFIPYRQGQRVLKCAKNKEGEQLSSVLEFNGSTQTFSKASGSYEVSNRMRRDAQKAKHQRQVDADQLKILPPDTPVPVEFEEEKH